MGEKTKEGLEVKFDKRLRLEFHGARITSDAGLLACRELDSRYKPPSFQTPSWATLLT